MATKPASTYDQIYGMVRNGYTGDSFMWGQTKEYIRHHPNELFQVVSPRKWSIGHQIIYHGNLKLFKDILSLYNEQTPINIFSTTNDPKPLTILDIAFERKSYFREQYEYIEHLFAQDKFLQAAKDFNWDVVNEMLNKDQRLLNEKPPYYSNYFIHYLVLSGDLRQFSQYTNLPNNKLQLDLKNANGKTPLDLAREANDQDFIREIQKLLPTPQPPPPPTFLNDRDDPNDREDDRGSPPPFSPPSHAQYTAPISTPAPAPLSAETRKTITCTLTKKIFVDPVTASDGQTYERQAIVEYFRDNRYSPITGETMDDTFTDNVALKRFIHNLRQKRVIP